METLLLALLMMAGGPYPEMAPAEQYQMAAADEISMARSAAPPAISGQATVLVLGAQGYDEATKGRNGFVCLVARSWATDLGDAEFWNPKVRAPICYNPPAARSLLPGYLKRTRDVLAGRAPTPSTAQPAVASMSYMLSPRGYLADNAGHWLPHLMFYLPKTDGAAWGAGVEGSPVVVHVSDTEPVTVFMVPVRQWSDGSPAPNEVMRVDLNGPRRYYTVWTVQHASKGHERKKPAIGRGGDAGGAAGGEGVDAGRRGGAGRAE